MDPAQKRIRIVEYARQIAGAEDSVESLESDRNPMYKWIENAQATEKERDAARRAVRKLARNEELAPDEMHAAEAIIMPEGRPAVDIKKGTYSTPPAPWTHLDQKVYRDAIEAAIPSIGRIEIPDHPSLPYAGTGFIVGLGLLMTNRHVAELFVSGVGVKQLRFRAGLERSGIDFLREIGSEATELFWIEKAVLIHPYWDMALLRVKGLSTARKPLTLEATAPADLKGKEIAIIGYPAQDPRNDIELQNKIFRNRYQVKRLQPGNATGSRRTGSFGHNVQALSHDSSTLGGNSGSAVVNVSTGRVVGLHFGGVYLESNYAVPAYALSCDPKVVDAGVLFTSTKAGPPRWQAYWDQADEATAGSPGAAGGGAVVSTQGATFTLNGGTVEITVPLRVTIALGAPAGGGAATSAAGNGAAGASASSIDADDARARALDAEALPYYAKVADEKDRDLYYQGIDKDADPDALFDALHDLITDTHDQKPAYAPSKWVYPWVDRQRNMKIRSVYSKSGRSYTFEEMLAMDEKVERLRQERIAELPATEVNLSSALEAIEAALPFNCEHVFPQSWFEKKEPMRGDIHHLFGCESGCNSFRGNRAYDTFDEEAVRTDCGQGGPNRFEPGAGRGAVARATLYFLVRYPGKASNAGELPEERLETLLEWHAEDPVGDWERHRNQAIFAIQSNRNPFIDFPELASRVNFKKGISGGEGVHDDEGAQPEIIKTR